MGTKYNQSTKRSRDQKEISDRLLSTSNGIPDPAGALRARLASGPPLLLDGALGTELERLGMACHLPLWSSLALLDAPERVSEIHRAYALAGCEILTANTFRTQRRTLARATIASRCVELTELAVRLARNASSQSEHTVFVAGSAPPLEDCYQPERVAEAEGLQREHTEHAENLAGAGVDLILVETHNTIREAEAAAKAAKETGLPFFVSFVCGSEARLLSGEELERAIDAVMQYGPLCVAVNCLPPSLVSPCLPVLKTATSDSSSKTAFGIYPNLGSPNEDGYSEACSPEKFAQHALGAVESGARLIGGCCGTTPDHMRAAASALNRLERVSKS